jgi:hypothetical protein
MNALTATKSAFSHKLCVQTEKYFCFKKKTDFCTVSPRLDKNTTSGVCFVHEKIQKFNRDKTELIQHFP